MIRVRARLLRRGFVLEYLTLGWNVAGIIILAVAAVAARSVALAGFGLDSLIEIGASTVVIWELSGTGEDRQRRGLRLIGYAFTALACYLLIQSTLVLAAGYHPRHSVAGIAWTAVTAAVMFALAVGKASTGRALGNPVLRTEGRVTMIDGILAVAVLAGLVLNVAVGWWWADRRRLCPGLLRRPGSARDLLRRALNCGNSRPDRGAGQFAVASPARR
jgi:divalent metal cation (Fe/Co/Zn/Cd) transporter